MVISTNNLSVWPMNLLLYYSLFHFHSGESKDLKQLNYHTIIYPFFSNSFYRLKINLKSQNSSDINSLGARMDTSSFLGNMPLISMLYTTLTLSYYKKVRLLK